MDTPFDKEVKRKLNDLIAANREDQLFDESELTAKAIGMVYEDRALSLIPAQTRVRVIQKKFNLGAAIYQAPGYVVELDTWFERLNTEQKAQVIAFLGIESHGDDCSSFTLVRK